MVSMPINHNIMNSNPRISILENFLSGLGLQCGPSAHEDKWRTTFCGTLIVLVMELYFLQYQK